MDELVVVGVGGKDEGLVGVSYGVKFGPACGYGTGEGMAEGEGVAVELA